MPGRLIFGSHAWHKSEDGAIDLGKPTKTRSSGRYYLTFLVAASTNLEWPLDDDDHKEQL